MSNAFLRLQQLGRALMLPIAVLPIAGLLLRLGQPDVLDVPMLAAAVAPAARARRRLRAATRLRG